jgi:hypothetical protein
MTILTDGRVFSTAGFPRQPLKRPPGQATPL